MEGREVTGMKGKGRERRGQARVKQEKKMEGKRRDRKRRGRVKQGGEMEGKGRDEDEKRA